jgi:hypothetical protein
MGALRGRTGRLAAGGMAAAAVAVAAAWLP